jgi:hypothetical protein
MTHALTLTSWDLFGKAMGNGRNIPDLTDDEFREWQHQNGELFLTRLGAWKRMGSTYAAAQDLRAARTYGAIMAVLEEHLARKRDQARMRFHTDVDA